MAELDQFSLARKRAQQRTTAETQEQKQALKRRFASMGGLGTGASIKAEQQAEQAGSERLQGAMEGIDVAQAQEAQRQKEIEQAREFQKSEREAAQKYASEESALGREFAKTERIESQSFADAQRLAAEQFQGAQNDEQRAMIRNQFNRTMFMEKQKMDIQKSQWSKQMALAMKQFGLDEKVTNANLEMQKWSKEAQQGKMRKSFNSIFGGRGSEAASVIFGPGAFM